VFVGSTLKPLAAVQVRDISVCCFKYCLTMHVKATITESILEDIKVWLIATQLTMHTYNIYWYRYARALYLMDYMQRPPPSCTHCPSATPRLCHCTLKMPCEPMHMMSCFMGRRMTPLPLSSWMHCLLAPPMQGKVGEWCLCALGTIVMMMLLQPYQKTLC
jgi:hypothetical protein